MRAIFVVLALALALVVGVTIAATAPERAVAKAEAEQRAVAIRSVFAHWGSVCPSRDGPLATIEVVPATLARRVPSRSYPIADALQLPVGRPTIIASFRCNAGPVGFARDLPDGKRLIFWVTR